MTRKLVYIRQPAGLGDILYLQKIARWLVDTDHTIIWPVIPEYEYIKEYIQHPEISFISLNSLNDQENELFKSNEVVKNQEYEYIPINILCHHMGNCDRVMESKYEYFNIPFDGWQDSINLIRNHEREQKCRAYFNIKEGDKFVFVNPLFASLPNIIKRNIKICTNLKIIENEEKHLDMFNLFDFTWILENAVEIHTVETSMCYLIETLDTRAKLSIYSRIINNDNQYPNFDYIKNVYKKDWNYIS